MKELHYNVTGQDRKELVGIISKVVGMKAVYKFMPTCAFVINNITVEKDGTIDIVNIGLHFFLKDVRPMLPPVMNHSIAVA